jgi:hypothetical protein
MEEEMSEAYDWLYNELGEGLRPDSAGWELVSKKLDAYAAEVRAQTLAEAEEKIREAAKGHPATGLRPKITTATGAAFLLRTLRASEES